MIQGFPRAKFAGLSLLLLCSCTTLPRPQTATTLDTSSPPSATVAPSPEKLLNINAASASELESLPGVGQALAERIIAYRKQYGPFRRAEHLMMVRGLSDHKFRAIRSLVTVE